MTVYHWFYSFPNVSIVDIHGDFMGLIVRGQLPRGNHSEVIVWEGTKFWGVIVRGEVVQEGIIQGQLSLG